jgi:CubicO group peptidase (beta-lactamase class C family)
MKLVAWISTALAVLDAAVAGVKTAPIPTARPVVLVHGIYSSSGDMKRLARHLERDGTRSLQPRSLSMRRALRAGRTGKTTRHVH